MDYISVLVTQVKR